MTFSIEYQLFVGRDQSNIYKRVVRIIRETAIVQKLRLAEDGNSWVFMNMNLIEANDLDKHIESWNTTTERLESEIIRMTGPEEKVNIHGMLTREFHFLQSVDSDIHRSFVKEYNKIMDKYGNRDQEPQIKMLSDEDDEYRIALIYPNLIVVLKFKDPIDPETFDPDSNVSLKIWDRTHINMDHCWLQSENITFDYTPEELDLILDKIRSNKTEY